MAEKLRITRLVRKRLEGHFNKEIIEREFDPSGNGLHGTTPLVAHIELAYLTAIDQPFKNVGKRRKMRTSVKRGNEQSLVDSVTPHTKRDTKLKGRAQPQDITRLSRTSEITLGKVPHVSHHVRAYLNAGEALRYSKERDERKLARQYKAKCRELKQKNLQNGNHSDARSEMYSPQSKLIDFRHLPLKAEPVEGTVDGKPAKPNVRRTRNAHKKNSPKSARFEPTFQVDLPSDNESQTSSVRKFYIRTESGMLPGDLVLSPKENPSIAVTKPNKSYDTTKGSLIGDGDSQELIRLTEADDEDEKNVNDELRKTEMKGDGGKHEEIMDGAQYNVRSDSYTDEASFTPPSGSDFTGKESEKDYNIGDSESFRAASRLSNTYSLNPGSPLVRGKDRPKTASRRSKEDLDEPPNHSQDGKELSQHSSVDNPTTTNNHDVITRDENIDDDGRLSDLDGRSEGSHDSIGDASSLIDEPSIKSLSLQDTYSGSYSLDFDDDDESSAFDTVSYHSRTRSKNGYISVPNEIGRNPSRRSVSGGSSITEEYIRTESVVSLR